MFVPRNASGPLIGSNRELRFLSDLGRGLLRALEPEQLVRRVAGATYDAADASLCAAYVTVGRDKHAVCVFDREGSADDPSLLDRDALRDWLRTSESANSWLVSERDSFLIRIAHTRLNTFHRFALPVDPRRTNCWVRSSRGLQRNRKTF